MQILHISDVEVRETKMMGTSPIIIFMVYAFILSLFQTQQVYCVRDRNGSITEGGQVKDNFFFQALCWPQEHLQT